MTDFDQFTPEGIAALAEVKKHMNAAAAAFARLNAVENQACLEYHIEGTSLNHCVRWGRTAAEDLLVEIDVQDQDQGDKSDQGDSPRFVVSPAWGHIFSGRKEETTRWAYDTAVGVLHAQVSSGPNLTKWSALDAASTKDLMEDITDNEALIHPGDFDLLLTERLPDWALAQINADDVQDAEVASTEVSTKYTAWCRQADGKGTTWVAEVAAKSEEDAIEVARNACASDWGWEEKMADILVVGLQPGNFELLWDDDGISLTDEQSDANSPAP